MGKVDNICLWMYWIAILSLLGFVSCNPTSESYDELEILEVQQEHDNSRMQFKLIQSKYRTSKDIFKPFKKDIRQFSEEEYQRLSDMIIEASIPELRSLIEQGELTFEQLSMYYIYRMHKYETNPNTSLHTIIALNPKALQEARLKDSLFLSNPSNSELHPIFGLPILLKDNINTVEIPTTAGAAILENNMTEDAVLVSNLKKNGAIVLGKTNLSEWAYYFCSGCPLGYSAIGGQTLNPYGRLIFETGGSSSGSGVATAANYAVGAIGTETSGSILSPSSQNSVVGLKPTIGQIAQDGIVPISKTLDTAGPMCKNVADNWILFEAMRSTDSSGKQLPTPLKLKGLTIGIPSPLLEDSLFMSAINRLESEGAEIVNFEPDTSNLDGFLSLLNQEMKQELPEYMKTYTQTTFLKSLDVSSIVAYNLEDSIRRAPYGQALFNGIIAEQMSDNELDSIRNTLMTKASHYFNHPQEKYELDIILSINNYHAGYAALAHRPCLTIPMGYKSNGEPANITLIGQSGEDDQLFPIGLSIEKVLNARLAPVNYP